MSNFEPDRRVMKLSLWLEAEPSLTLTCLLELAGRFVADRTALCSRRRQSNKQQGQGFCNDLETTLPLLLFYTLLTSCIPVPLVLLCTVQLA